MKNLLSIAILVAVLGCKEQPGHIFTNDELNGIAYLQDPVLETGAVLAPKLDVYLYDGGITKNFLQKTAADEKAKFRFIFQPQQKDRILIVSEYRDSASLLYRASANAEGFKDSLILTPQYSKGLVKIRTTDANGAHYPGMDVYLFTNPDLAATARSGKPTGAIKAIKSNDKALALFHGLDPANYYVVGKKDSVTATLVDTVTVSPYPEYKSSSRGNQITPLSPLGIRLYEAPVLYTVTVKSNKDQPLAGTDVYLFSSLAQANSVKKEAMDFILKQKTGSSGRAEFRRLPTGNFYFAANGRIMGPDSLLIRSAIHVVPVSFPINTPLTDPQTRSLTLTINTDN